MSDTLAQILAAAARGAFPAPDGTTTIVEQPSARDAGVLAFTAHSVVFTDEDPRWVRSTLAATPSDALPGGPDLELREIRDPDHPRVTRAVKYRDDVRVWAADGGVVVLGRGVAGRWETAIEVDEAARARGLGKRLARAARHLVPDAVVWAQQSPGNARSVRTFQAAGFRPVGSEALLIPG